MKLFKKAAALFFCLALALSVMAVSASATDPTVAVTLVLNSEETYTDLDNNNKYELNANTYITYDIQIALTDAEGSPLTVNGVAFKAGATAALPTGVAISQVLNGASGTNSIPVNNYGAYGIYAEGTTADITVSGTPTTIGRITYSIAATVGATAVAEFVPQLTEVSVSQRDVGSLIDSATVTAEKGVEVNPRYTVTFYDYESDTNGTQKAKTYDADNPAPSMTYTYTDGGTFDTEANALGVTAYNFDYWVVTSNAVGAAGGWTAVDTTYNTYVIASGKTISPGKVGNIVLTAQYTAKTYTVTYEYDKDSNDHEKVSAGTYPTTYTIEQIADATADTNPFKDFFTTDPAWVDGFAFDGWTVKPTTSDGDYNDDVWGTIPEGATTVVLAPTSLAALVGAYGDVTLHAKCKELGIWAVTNYAYAYNTDSLILYAVNKNDVVSGAVYKCGGTAMFIIPTAKYWGLSAFSDKSAADYTMYAYLGVATAGARPSITIDVSENKGDPNEDLTNAYDGNVLADSYINAGDFGLVNSILVKKAASTADTFGESVAMRARLLMDMASKKTNGDNDFASESGASFGSIEDIKAIADLVGASSNVNGT